MHMRICQRLVTTATHFESVPDIQTETSTGTCAQETRLEIYVYNILPCATTASRHTKRRYGTKLQSPHGRNAEAS